MNDLQLALELIRNTLKNGQPEVIPGKPLVIACAPWPVGIAGSKQDRCTICNALVSISPETVAMMKSRGNIDKPHCMRCADKGLREEKVKH